MGDNILLLHGALGSAGQFDQLKQVLTPKWNVHTFNFDGHGGQLTDTEFSIDLFTANALAFIQEKGIAPTHIFGYSMGGYVALNLATKHPQLVGSIITLGTKFDWTLESAAVEVKMLNPDKIEEKVPHFAEKLKAIHQQSDWKSVMSRTARMMLDLGNGKRVDEAAIAQVNNNVLIGVGDKDNMVTVMESEKTANLLPNGALKVIEGFQHPIEKVDIQKLATIIIDYLKLD